MSKDVWKRRAIAAFAISLASTTTGPAVAGERVADTTPGQDLFFAGFDDTAELISCGRTDEATRYSARVLMILRQHYPDATVENLEDGFFKRVQTLRELQGLKNLSDPEMKKLCDFRAKEAWSMLPYYIRQLNKSRRGKR